MFDVFHKTPLKRFTAKVPTWDWIKRSYLDTILPKVEGYYRNTPYPVPNQHLLVRLIQTMNIPFDAGYEDYIFRAELSTPRVVSSLGIIHPVSRGKLWSPGIFYNGRAKELILANTESFDVEYAVNHWEDLCPIRVLRHDYSDLSLARADGLYPVQKNGWVVISINVPMLMLQYRRFMETSAEASRDHDAPVWSNAVFVGRYPLTNMVRSHLDLCIWNRWVNYCRGLKNDKVSTNPHPFFLPDYSSKIDDAWKLLEQAFYQKKLTFDDMLGLVPLISQDNALDLVVMPDNAVTRNISWAHAIALLPEIVYVIDMNVQFDNPVNSVYTNDLRRDLYRITSDNLFRRYLPTDAYQDIKQVILHSIDERID